MEKSFPNFSSLFLKTMRTLPISVTLTIMVLSVGDHVVATFSVEMSDSSYIFSRSSVPVEVAKSWPCSTGVDSIASLLFPLPSGPCLYWFSSMSSSGWTSTSNIAFCPSEDFCLLVSTILPETIFPPSVRFLVIISTKEWFLAFLSSLV